MPKHIRHQRHYEEEDCTPVRQQHGAFSSQYYECLKQKAGRFINGNQPYGRIRHNEGAVKKEGNYNNIMMAIIVLIIALVAAHYMGYITLPDFLADILPRKAAPASHLQYFFF